MVLSAVGRHRCMMGSEASASPCCIRGRPHPRCLEASPQQCPRDGCCLVPTRDITRAVGGSPELQSHAGSRSLLDQRKAQPPMASPRSSEPNAAAQHLTRPRLDLQTISCVFLKSRFLYRGSQLRALADWIRGHWTTRRAGDMEVSAQIRDVMRGFGRPLNLSITPPQLALLEMEKSKGPSQWQPIQQGAASIP